MGFSSQFKALLKKNLIYWYRHLCGSLCEIIFPIAMMCLIVWIRYAIDDTAVPEQSYFSKLGFGYYMDSNTKAIPGTSLNMQNNMGLPTINPFMSCMMYKRPIIAFVGNNELNSKISNALFGPSGSIF